MGGRRHRRSRRSTLRRSAPACGTAWRRRGRVIRAKRRVVRRRAIGAPEPLDLAAVEVDDRDALVEVAVGHVAFVRLRIDEDLGDAAEVVHVHAVGHVGRLVGGRRLLHARVLLAVLRHELAVAGELQDVRVGPAVAANPHEALVIHDDAVIAFGPIVGIALGLAAPAADQVAGGVELEHRRRGIAALANAGRAFLRHRKFGAVEVARIVAAVNDPHVVIG